MIIIRLCCGLGNQMFQYAAGRRLAKIHKTDLYLDINHYAFGSLRYYRLDKFNINAEIASPHLLKKVPLSRLEAFRIGIKKLG